MSPAHRAVEHGDLPGLRDLLDAGHDVEDDSGDDWTILRHAVSAAFLLARGADSLRQRSGLPVVAETETRGRWLAAEIMRAWSRRGQHPAAT